jgi:hypothetical protein
VSPRQCHLWQKNREFCCSFLLISNFFFYRTISFVHEIVSWRPMSVYNAVSLWNCVVLARRSLRQCWLLFMTEEWLPPTFFYIRIFETYAQPASLLRMLLLHNLSSLATGELDHFSLSVRFDPLWHTCSHSPRDYAQVTDNWLTFVDYLLVIYLR